ncbi:MAG: DUF4625 domain-containing protein [Bernardetiaceae bacterium]|nr:DUF4625 domain-containing protein [Bernardetiaceae bacterium]
MNKSSYLWLLALLFFFTACNNDDEAEPIDTTPPTVSQVTINGFSKDDEIKLNQGTRIHFDAVFQDDVALGQFKIDIHDASEGHNHGGRIEGEPWSFVKVFDLLNVRRQTVHEHIDIPENAMPGPYHFLIQYFDEAGNEGELYELEFEILSNEG